MSLHFRKEDVLLHLESLGYKDIGDDQLREFMADLKRLVRYEEKHKRIEAHVEFRKHQRRRRHVSADSTYSSGSAISLEGSAADEPDDGRRKPFFTRTRRREKSFDSTRESVIKTSTLSYDSGRSPSFSMTRKEVKVVQRTTATPDPSSSPTSDEESHSSVRVKVKIRSFKGEEEDVHEGGGLKLLHEPSRGTFPELTLPKRPTLPTKPTTSCIKPLLADPKPKAVNRDPVRLYHFYRKHWEKLKLPGGDHSKGVRWAMREWMMSEPPQP